MNTQVSVAKRIWVGWMVAGLVVSTLLYVGVTGEGLGSMPTPVPRRAPIQAATPVAGDPAGGQTIATGSTTDSLTTELKQIGVLAADEQLIADTSAAWPNCRSLIVGPANAYRGRMCESAEGLYRLNADGSDAGARWQRDEAGAWYIHLPVEQQTAQ